jgi:hypothetical protein
MTARTPRPRAGASSRFDAKPAALYAPAGGSEAFFGAVERRVKLGPYQAADDAADSWEIF